MTIRSAAARGSWEAFLGTARPPTFLQSWAWGDVQDAQHEEVIRLEAVEDDRIVGLCQAVTVTARRGSFLHIPHGPVTAPSLPKDRTPRAVAAALLTATREEAQRKKLAFLRVSPIQVDQESGHSLYQSLGFRNAPIHLHAERLWILDLTPTEDLLLANMRKTTRQLIRRSERDGLRVRFSASAEALAEFLSLYTETARREHFVPFSSSVLKNELQIFGASDSAVVATAYFQQKCLAAALIIFTPWSAFYHHGASSRAFPHVPASHALQWAVIREAKRRGCQEYNFWGVLRTSEVSKSHPWAGLTIFKTGFGGVEVALVPTQDLPLSLGYWPAFGLDKFRRWRRGL